MRAEVRWIEANDLPGWPGWSPSGHRDAIAAVAFGPDGKRLASGSGFGDRTVRVWDVAAGTIVWTGAGHTNTVNGLGFSRDGRRLASASADNTVRVWKLAD